VAVANGMADVFQVIAAIDWVVTHREELNIRVLNLAFGTDGIQDRRLDPLSHAVEHAWHKGIVVVEVGIDLEIAVNLSTWSLLDVHLADDIRGLLGEYAMPPRRLRLEITETSMMADPHRSAEILTMISDMKVGLSVDDFGTGTRRWRG
jgi:hypothetical protein